MMVKRLTDAVTAEDVSAAQAALKDGESELVRLKEGFLNGDGVEWSAVKSQEAVVEYAEAEIERLGRAKVRHDEVVRQEALVELRGELDAFAKGNGAWFADLAEQIGPAVLSFAKAFSDRNAKLREFQTRMIDLGVAPRSNDRVSPSAVHGGMDHCGSGDINLRAGDREFSFDYSGQYLQELIRGLWTESGLERVYFYPLHDFVSARPVADVYARVAAIDSAEYPTEPGGYFYRQAEWTVTDINKGGVYAHTFVEGGVVSRFDEEITDQAELSRRGIAPISREEALSD